MGRAALYKRTVLELPFPATVSRRQVISVPVWGFRMVWGRDSFVTSAFSTRSFPSSRSERNGNSPTMESSVMSCQA